MDADRTESKKSIIGVVMFLSLMAIIIAALYIYDASAGNSTKSDVPTPTPSVLPLPSGNLEINLGTNDSGKEVLPVTDLMVEDIKVGDGPEAIAGKKVTVNYLGLLTNGQKFDSSYDRNSPFSFNLGAGEVIPGWDQGVVGMKVGGKRKLTIPSSLAYGEQGVPNSIPGGATLIFEVELLAVE